MAWRHCIWGLWSDRKFPQLSAYDIWQFWIQLKTLRWLIAQWKMQLLFYENVLFFKSLNGISQIFSTAILRFGAALSNVFHVSAKIFQRFDHLANIVAQKVNNL